MSGKKDEQTVNKYDSDYIEEQKKGTLKKGNFIYKEAMADVRETSKLSKFLNHLQKVPGLQGFIGMLGQKILKRKAENRLHEMMAKKETLQQQQKNLDERRENLDKRGKNLQTKRKKNAKDRPKEAKKPDPLKDNAEQAPVDGDMQYKDWKGGLGFDVINASQIMAKSDDEKALSEFKKDVLKKVKTDLNAQIQERNNQLKDINSLLLNALGEAPKGPQTNERFARIRQDEERLKNETEQYEKRRKQYVAGQERLEKLPGLIKKNEARLEEFRNRYNEDKAAYEKGLKLKKQAEEELHMLEQQLKDAGTEKEGKWFSVNPSVDIASLEEKIKHREEQLEKLNAALAKNGGLAVSHYYAVQSLVTEKAAMEEEKFSLQNAVPPSKEGIEKAQREIQINRKLFRSSYADILRWQNTIYTYEQQVKSLKNDLETAKKDVMDARIDHALLKSGRTSVRCIAVNGKIYLDPKDLEEKHLPSDVELNFKETQRLKSTQSLIKYLQNQTIMKFLNSDNLAEYMTYNEDTGEFDLFDGKPSDKAKKQEYHGNLHAKYFPNDIMYLHNLVDNDPNQYALNIAEHFLAESISAFERFKEHPGEKLKAAGKTVVKFIGKTALKILAPGVDEAIEEFGNSDEEPTLKEEGIAALKMLPDYISNASLGLSFILKNQSSAFDNKIMTDALVDCSFIQAMQKMHLFDGDGFSLNGTTAAGIISNLATHIKTIAQNYGKSKKQCDKAKEELAKGHLRFSRLMEEAMATTDRELVSNIISAGADIAANTFKAATGSAGLMFTVAFKAVGYGVDGIYGLATAKKNAVSFAKSDSVLSGIEAAAGTLSEDDVKQVFREVSGIRSLARMADMVKIVDAIDMHRTLKKQPNNKSVPSLLRTLGFKSDQIGKITVKDILKKISGDGNDYHKRIRDAIEDTINTNPTGIKRWFKTMFGTIKNRILGIRKGHIENTFDKQRAIQAEMFGKEGLKLNDAATWLYQAYKEQPNDGNKVKVNGVRSADTLIKLFSKTKAAKELLNIKNFDEEEITIKPAVMRILLPKAVREANEIVEKAKDFMQAQNSNQEPQNKPVEFVPNV